MKKVFRIVLWMLFVLYSYVVLSLLLFGRGVITDVSVWEHISTESNFIPFKTAGGQILQYLTGENRGFAMRNLGGNFFLLFPIGMLLPCLFPRCNRLWRIAGGMTVFILVAELLQGVLRIGFIDIDDLIFNVVGGVLGFSIVQIPFLNRWLRHIGAMVSVREERDASK